MAHDTTTTTYEPKRYKHRPTVVSGIFYDGTPECAEAIIAWAPGKFLFDDDTRLCCFTPEGLRYVPERNTAMLDAEGRPYSVREAIIGLCFDAANGSNDYSAPLTLDRVREIQDQARHTAEPDRLRELIDQLVFHIETRA